VTGALDAHVHLWNRATDPQPWIDPATMARIDRDFGVGDLDRMLASTGVEAAVVVHAGHSRAETARLLALESPRIAGVVGWIDLTADVPAQLDQLNQLDQLDQLDQPGAAGPRAPGPAGNRLVGIRHLAHVDPDPEWAARPEVGAGLDRLAERDLGFDLVLRAAQLPLATSVVSARPRTRFVLDHLGGIAETDDEAGWASDLRRLAERPNVCAKISGLARLAGPEAGDTLRRLVDIALEAFGPERLMYGSDWPLAELGAGAPAWRAAVTGLIGSLSAAEQASIMAGTAAGFYRLAA
jgi:L-fuconolactonase